MFKQNTDDSRVFSCRQFRLVVDNTHTQDRRYVYVFTYKNNIKKKNDTVYCGAINVVRGAAACAVCRLTIFTARSYHIYTALAAPSFFYPRLSPGTAGPGGQRRVLDRPPPGQTGRRDASSPVPGPSVSVRRRPPHVTRHTSHDVHAKKRPYGKGRKETKPVPGLIRPAPSDMDVVAEIR